MQKMLNKITLKEGSYYHIVILIFEWVVIILYIIQMSEDYFGKIYIQCLALQIKVISEMHSNIIVL